LLGLSNYQIIILLNINEKTLIKTKKIIIEKSYTNFIRRIPKIGGRGVITQIDETAVCRRRMIRNPTSELLEQRDTVWVIGIIDDNNPNNLRIEVLENRRTETILDFLQRNVLEHTTIRSDVYIAIHEQLRQTAASMKLSTIHMDS
jgi:hypothetical protein